MTAWWNKVGCLVTALKRQLKINCENERSNDRKYIFHFRQLSPRGLLFKSRELDLFEN